MSELISQNLAFLHNLSWNLCLCVTCFKVSVSESKPLTVFKKETEFLTAQVRAWIVECKNKLIFCVPYYMKFLRYVYLICNFEVHIFCDTYILWFWENFVFWATLTTGKLHFWGTFNLFPWQCYFNMSLTFVNRLYWRYNNVTSRFQGSYPYSETNFQDFSRTRIFQVLENSH